MEVRRWLLWALLLFGTHLLESTVIAREIQNPHSRAKRNAACGEALAGTDGTFSLPVEECMYENVTFQCYSKNLQCQWTIAAPAGHIVMLNSDNFYLEDSNDCEFDYVEIVESDGGTSRHCGWEPLMYISTTNQLTINFKSDETFEGTGFTFEYRAYVPDTRTHCNTSIVGGAGGKIYNDDTADTSCFYAIQAPDFKVVELSLKMINFGSNQCEEESLVIHPGHTTESKAVETVCSERVAGLLMEDYQYNSVFIEYRNIIGSEFERFEIEYRFLDEPPPPSPLPPSQVGGDPDCSGLFTEESEWTWTSPTYEANRHCIVVIRNVLLEQGVIQVTFERFRLEESEGCIFDFFTVKSGERNESQALGGPYCGKSLHGRTLASYGNSLRMEFKTDESLSWFGVKANIRIVPKRECDVCNTGVCVISGYEKLCVKGKECDSNLCFNGGTCVKTKNSQTCHCPTGYSGADCSQGSTSTVQLKKAPRSQKHPKGTSVYEQCEAENAERVLSYQWLFNGDLLPEYTTKNKFGAFIDGYLAIDDISEDQQGWYTCIVVTEDGNVEHTFEITVVEDCFVDFRSRPDPFIKKRAGDSVLLPCSAKFASKIYWEKADSPDGPFQRLDIEDSSKFIARESLRSGVISKFLQIKDAQMEDAGVYRCVVENELGCYNHRQGELKMLTAQNYKKYCGISRHDEDLQGRIQKGEDARPGEYPWHTTLRSIKKDGSSTVFCGGSLITSKHVLTAAHCIAELKDFSKTSVQILLGSEDCTTSRTIRKPENYWTHPNFNKSSYYDSDIAVIELNNPVEFNSDIRPICLDVEDNVEKMFFESKPRMAAQMGTVAGCGKLRAQFSSSASKLQVVSLPYVARDLCQEQVENYNEDNPDKPFKLTENMICAGYQDSTKADSCQGDSGGALIMHNFQWFQTGIVSFGLPCKRHKNTGLVGFYTNVAKFYDWINKHTQFIKEDCTYCDWV